MPDSPRCLDCLKNGLIGQTYKVAGQRAFKCQSCKKTYAQEEFTPLEMAWRDKYDDWKEFVQSKGIEIRG